MYEIEQSEIEFSHYPFQRELVQRVGNRCETITELKSLLPFIVFRGIGTVLSLFYMSV